MRSRVGLALGLVAALGAPVSAHAAGKVVTVQSAIDPGDAVAAEALTRMQADPFRSGQPLIGDGYPDEDFSYRLNLECAAAVADLPPKTTVELSADQRSYIVRFTSRPANMCDLMGTTTEKLRILRRAKNGRYKLDAPTIRYVNGIAEVITHYLPERRWQRYVRKTVTVPRLGSAKPCGARTPRAHVRVDDVRSFNPNPDQTFQSPENAGPRDYVGRVKALRGTVRNPCRA